MRGEKCFHQRGGGKFIARRGCDAGWGRKNRNSLSVAIVQWHDVRDAVALGAVQPNGRLVADAHVQSDRTGAVALMKVLVELPKEGRSNPEAPGVGAHGEGGHVPVPLARLLRLRRRIPMPMPTLLLLIPGGRETDPPVVGVQVLPMFYQESKEDSERNESNEIQRYSPSCTLSYYVLTQDSEASSNR